VLVRVRVRFGFLGDICLIVLHICPNFHSFGFKSMFAIMVLYYLKQLANKTLKSKSFTTKSKTSSPSLHLNTIQT